MKNITIPVFQIHELAPKYKTVAISTVLEAYVHDDMNASLQNCFAQVLYDAGYPTTDISYSLANCQGDGVAFYTPKHDVRSARLALAGIARDDVDLPRLWVRRGLWSHFTRAQRRMMYWYWAEHTDVRVRITRNSHGYHYSHFNTMQVTIEGPSGPWDFPEDETEVDALVTELAGVIQDDVRKMSKTLETTGYQIIEDLTNDDAVKGLAESMELYFYADGRLAPA